MSKLINGLLIGCLLAIGSTLSLSRAEPIISGYRLFFSKEQRSSMDTLEITKNSLTKQTIRKREKVKRELRLMGFISTSSKQEPRVFWRYVEQGGKPHIVMQKQQIAGNGSRIGTRYLYSNRWNTVDGKTDEKMRIKRTNSAKKAEGCSDISTAGSDIDVCSNLDSHIRRK